MASLQYAGPRYSSGSSSRCRFGKQKWKDDAVKLEPQVLVTEDGYEMLTAFPLEADLLD